VFKLQIQRERKNSKIALKQNMNLQNQITNLQNLQASNNKKNRQFLKTKLLWKERGIGEYHKF
jgi:hypothetical protein